MCGGVESCGEERWALSKQQIEATGDTQVMTQRTSGGCLSVREYRPGNPNASRDCKQESRPARTLT